MFIIYSFMRLSWPFIPTNLHNQIRQSGSRRGPVTRRYVPGGQQAYRITGSRTRRSASCGHTATKPQYIVFLWRISGQGVFLLSGKSYKSYKKLHKKRLLPYTPRISEQKKTAAGCREKQNKKRLLPAARNATFATP